MKRIFIVSIILLFAALAASAQTEAPEKRLNSAPQVFRTFFSGFLRAVGKADRSAVAAMTQFPFNYGFDAGDEGTMTRTQFIKRFADVFGKHPREFMTEKNPVFSRGDDGSYMVSTQDAAHLVFVKRKGAFKFTDYVVEP